MRPLAIGPEEKASLLAMKAYARSHPLTVEQLKRIGCSADRKTQVEYLHDRENYVRIPVGFEVGLTYELQEPDLWHVSMSVDAPNRLPHPAAVAMVLIELGFPPTIKAVAREIYGTVVNLWFFANDEEQRSVVE